MKMPEEAEEMLLEKLSKYISVSDFPLGSPEYWKAIGQQEAYDDAKEIVENYLKEKGYEII